MRPTRCSAWSPSASVSSSGRPAEPRERRKEKVMDDAIRTYRLTKHYFGRKVVDALDLRVPRGTVYGLLGRNGAGKSTTLKILAGMVRPDSGQAEVLGEDAGALS